MDPEEKSSKEVRIALVGNPNSGKSTVFNHLTGLHQRTGNFPGVTVEKKTGILRLTHPNGKTVTLEITDLPGTYSLMPRSLDERITADFILRNEEAPHLILVIADASNLKRSLFLISQLKETGRPMVVVLNMMDMVAKNGDKIDLNLLRNEYGVSFIPCNSRTGEGINEIKDVLEAFVPSGTPKKSTLFNARLNESFGQGKSETEQREDSVKRYGEINKIIEKAVIPGHNRMNALTSRADKFLTHRYLGFIIFLSILFLMFQTLFYLASWPMDVIDRAFSYLGNWVHLQMGEGELSSLIADGVIPGVGGVLMFVPQIALLFLFISALEDSGYMSRVSFIMDRLFKKFGMSGRSVIPLMSGLACAIPAIMGTRTISNWKERMITIMVTPLMSCSARLPVFALTISLVVPEKMLLGIFNLQGMVLMGLYLLGFIAALLTAYIIKLVLKAKEKSYFIMELPVYRWPKWNSILLTILDKVKVFVVDAGKVILAISVILWYLSSHGPGENYDKLSKEDKLTHSWAGKIGQGIEPVIKPLGFDWKIGIALVTSFAAREVFVGTIATIYSVGNTDDLLTIRQKLANEKREDGTLVFNFPMGISLLLFYLFAMQCMSTLAVVKRETNSWKWPIVQLIYMTALAWVSSFIAYQSLT